MLGDMMRSLFLRPATRRYPVVRQSAPERLRGKLHWTPDKCTGCSLCIKDCPAQAIELIDVDRAAKRFVMRYYVDRCTFCGQCVQSCRFKCIEMSSDDWELSALDKKSFTVTYGREDDLGAVVENAAAAEDTPMP
jgi:formate hydrogenlyase subunit 6/NADH:ubiquinone oxidoreductase subunit I